MDTTPLTPYTPPSAPAGRRRCPTRRVPRRTGLAGQLAAEWRQLCLSPTGLRAAAEWALDPTIAPVLPEPAGGEPRWRLDGIVQAIQHPAISDQTPDRSRSTLVARRDAALLTLLIRHQAGDPLAGRTVLELMTPKVLALTRRLTPNAGWDEAFAVAAAAMWQVIATYPTERRERRSVAAHLGFAAGRIAYGATARQQELPCEDVTSSRIVASWDPEPFALGGDGASDLRAAELLAWAVRRNVVTLAEAQLLAKAYGVHNGSTDPAALAAEHGITRAAMRQRCHRLIRRIAAAAAAEGLLGDECPSGQGAHAALLAVA